MDIVARATVAFLILFLLLRVLGRRELSSMEPFDLILLVVIGDLIQQGVTQSDMTLTGSMLAIGTFAILTVLVSWLVFRFRRLRPVLDAGPLIILQDGKLVEHNLRQERLTEDEVAAAARQQQIASLDDVAWAVLEGNGRISFIPRS
ncbi:MAG TPA: YetF domain-containing protein [Gaiellaceae bacterium]|nr:YetF domain-containing protein [Gaiellaceae bacterium]